MKWRIWETKPGNTHFKSPFSKKKKEIWLKVMTANDLFTEQVKGFFDISSDFLLNLVPIDTDKFTIVLF